MAVCGPILSCDLATASGFAFGTPGEKLIYGAVRLGGPGSSVGQRLHAFRRWFYEFTALSMPSIFVFEAPLNVGVMNRIGSRPETVRLLFGLCAVAEEAAIDRGIPVIREVNVQDVRKHFLGQRTFAGGRKESKAAVIHRCQQLGWSPQDDNVADALAIWSLAESIYSPATSSQRMINAMAAGVPERLSSKEYRDLGRRVR